MTKKESEQGYRITLYKTVLNSMYVDYKIMLIFVNNKYFHEANTFLIRRPYSKLYFDIFNRFLRLPWSNMEFK